MKADFLVIYLYDAGEAAHACLCLWSGYPEVRGQRFELRRIMSASLVSVVLPFGRSVSRIEATLRGYLATLADLNVPFELLPVFDAVPGTRQFDECRALFGREPRVRTLSAGQAGWGRAVQYGLSESKGDLICYTQAARTSPVDLLAVLQIALSHPNNVVKANRRIRDGLVRRMGSLLYVAECRSLFDLPFWDINGTPKVFPRTLGKLLSLRSTDDLIDLEFDVVCRRELYQVIEVPLTSVDTGNAFSDINLSSAWHLYIGAFRLWKEMREK
jgi:hypothetical protein